MACVLVIYKQLFNHLFIQQLFAECLLCAGLCARPWGLRPADIRGFLEAPTQPGQGAAPGRPPQSGLAGSSFLML